MVMNHQITGLNLGFPLADTGTSIQDKKAENVVSFKDFLNNSTRAEDTVKSSPVRSSSQRKDDKNSINSADDHVKYQTFKEVQKGMKTDARKAMIQGKMAPVEDNGAGSEAGKTEEDPSNSQKAEVILNCMAQVMGIKADDLAKLLESAGIKAEELASISGSNALQTKLAQALGLDEKMGGTLGKILKLIDTQVEDTLSKLLQDGNNGKIQQAVTGESAGNASKTNADTPGISDLLLQFRSKLKEMGEKLEKNDAALVQEISFKIQPVLNNMSAMQKSAVNPTGTDELAETDTGVGEDTVNSVEAKEDGPARSESKSDKAAESDAVIPQQALSQPEAKETAQAFGNIINQLQGKEPDASTDDLNVKLPVTGKEILNQVIEKAKVVLTADKSEMVMELKPESLGKLSLKVVTEQGIVMAKFVAENQQVKQVLETNMQLLKDSMEKQGLNVQGFSVSVRQESQGGQSGYNNRDGGSRRISEVQMPGSSRIYADAAHIERLQRINPYKQDGNTINLTA